MRIRLLDPHARADVRQWVRFPFELYRGARFWVPPLRADAAALLDPEKHPFYEHSAAAFFVAEEGGRTLGRICALNNRHYNAHSQLRRAGFGFLEMIEDQAVCSGLLDAACDWARGQRLEDIAGPRDLLGADAAGILVEGFDRMPALSVPWNYPYYDRLIQAAGWSKETDNLGGVFSGEGLMPERLERIAERIRQRHGFSIKMFGPREDLKAWVKKVAGIYTEAFWENRDFYPLTDGEMDHFAESILSIADRQLVKLVLKGDDVVGFLLSYPNIGRGLQRARGYLWPLGWACLLWEKRTTHHLDVNGVGILPPYQGMGVNALLYCELAKSIKAMGYGEIDVVHVDETNARSRSDQEALGVQWVKRHRSYYRQL